MAGAPTSAVDICNLALDHLRVDASVTSIETPTSDEEEVCARWYHQTRRDTLREAIWNFAAKRVVLTSSTDEPVFFNFSKFFNLPNDYIRLATLGDENNPITDYELEGGRILISSTQNTDSDNLNMRYVSDFTIVSKFDPKFISLLAINLAVNMSYKFGGQNNNLIRIEKLQAKIRLSAGAVDGQERPTKKIQRSRFTGSRKKKMASSNVAGPISSD